MAKTKEERAKYWREWVKNNPDKISVIQKRYKNKNREKILASMKEYRTNNPERIAAIKRKSRYGIEDDQYKKLIEEQGGRCAICHKECKLHVDHDHLTSRVRGLLCRYCNSGIGYVEESIETLQNMIKYLKKHKI